MIAEIIINSNARALNRIFDYIVPTELEEKVKVGARILVPFGNGKKLEDGFIIGLKDYSINYPSLDISEIESLSKEYNSSLRGKSLPKIDNVFFFTFADTNDLFGRRFINVCSFSLSKIWILGISNDK